MRMSARARFCSFLAVAFLSACTTASAQKSDGTRAVPLATQRPDLSNVEDRIVKATNDFRAEQGRRRVEVNLQLKGAAEGFARYMAKTGRYGHEADGRQPSDRVKAAGYAYCIVAENIAYAYSSADIPADKLVDTFVTGWKNSPRHRENMLDPDVTETAVAVARSPDTGYYYAVQLFGMPKSAEIAFQVSNESGMEIRYTVVPKAFTLPPDATRTHYACRPPEVKLATGEGKQPDVLKPGRGTKLTVRRADGGAGLVVDRQENVEMPPPVQK